MTRDFLISFNNETEAAVAEKVLKEIYVDNKVNLFEEVDNRGLELFVVLTYPHEITDSSTVNINNEILKLDNFVVFVAIKNGEHQAKGFAYFSDEVRQFSPKSSSHVSAIQYSALDYFNVN